MRPFERLQSIIITDEIASGVARWHIEPDKRTLCINRCSTD